MNERAEGSLEEDRGEKLDSHSKLRRERERKREKDKDRKKKKTVSGWRARFAGICVFKWTTQQKDKCIPKLTLLSKLIQIFY